MIVLDTHIWLWLLSGNDSLSVRLRKRIEAEPEQVLVSAISFWEARVLAEKKRVSAKPAAMSKLLRQSLIETGFREAPISAEIALFSRELEFSHEDPADRFIAATAHVYGASLATVDDRLQKIRWLKTIT